MARCSFEEGEKFIAYAPVHALHWSVGVIMPVEEVVAPALTTKGKIASASRDTAEKERMQKELEIARGIQQSFLPDSSPHVDGMDLAAFNLPALEIGGDFYDFIPLSKDRWGLVIADVSGKGVPAALFMALSRTLIRASTASNPKALEAIKQANRLLCEDSKTACS